MQIQINETYLIIGVALLFLCSFLIFGRKKTKTKIDMRKIDRMTGVEFENYFTKILLDNGFKSIQTTTASSDYGIDILCSKNGKKYGLQLKRYKGKVGVAAVQEAVSGTIYYGAKIPCVVTNSFFTAQAIKMADKCNVILVDRNNFENDIFSFK